MASVKKNEKPAKAKAGSNKTGRSPTLKPKEKAAVVKKTAAPSRARVSKPASKKSATAKTPTTARSAANRQRTVASNAASRNAARGAATTSARATDKDTKKAETAKTKTAARTNSTAKAADTKVSAKSAAGKAAATKSAATKTAASKSVASKTAPTKTTAKVASKAPAATSKAKVLDKVLDKSSAKPSSKPAVATEESKKLAPSKAPAQVKPEASKAVKKAEPAPALTKEAAAQKNIAAMKDIAAAKKLAIPLQTVVSHPVSTKAAPAEQAPESIKLTAKPLAPQSSEAHQDSASIKTVTPTLQSTDSSVVRPAEPVALAKKAEEKIMIGKAAKPSAPTDTAVLQDAKSAVKPAEVKVGDKAIVKPAAKPATPGKGFKVSEFIVYPAHGVGEIVAIEEQEVAGFKLELFVISFIKDKMILKVPVTKVATVGMRKLAESGIVKKALDTLMGRARVKRTMWSRRAQEYEAKINSGDLVAIAEVVRDLYRSDAQPEQSYSERQLYEAALDRLAREVGTVQKLTETEALKVIELQLQKGPRRTKGDEADVDQTDGDADEGEIEEAA